MAKTLHATVRRTMVGAMLATLAFTPGLFHAPAAQATHDATTKAASPLSGNHIRNYYSGKCLVARDYNPGTGAVQFDCGAYADQNWVLVARTQYDWEIKNSFTHLCLSVQTGAALEQQLVDAPCDTPGDFKTEWGIEFHDDYAVIYNRINFGCLPVRGTANEAPVVTTACNPNRFTDQRWVLTG